ncbi:C40 family peptidase [Mycolicibacterium novocastrense]|uniref:C40 family peptidase n=1 Tax=Mycolicibacterium novocastrense TaxID=59813 RepID=A0AAW5SGY9_MYCNV|nr:C40 family peptidase [Mycolicibacterium novocastrense]MCV7023365.1 C40 family peptidase [Mycolicibacterium novocastrense]GAT12418.1 cell wall-associated hydrolase, invasion-associated protein [Mycolicibacterium novocastrense]
MPSGLIAGLTAPLREVQSLVGSGSAAELATALRDAHHALREVSASVGQAWGRAAQHWAGAGADAAAGVFTAAVTRTDELAERVGRLGAAAETADAAVARARERLSDIVDTFEARAAALEPFLDSPGVTEELVAEARRSLAEAVAVVDELRAELDGHADGFPTAPSAPVTGPAPTSPAGFSAPGFGGGGVPAGGAGSGASGLASGASTGGLGSLVRDIAEWSRPEPPDAARFGDGVAVRLPDGSTATAPNAVAASAVRYALTQLGVPYDWGGTTPGVGLDCSGLTQWAYSEAGLTLPRLAQEQDVGAPVGAGDLRPGDLAIWDGHVAMVVGNGQMIEAGDPVQLSPIRTTNAGQGFQGFWRPTA